MAAVTICSDFGPPGGGHGNPLQYSCLENPTDRGAWGSTVKVLVAQSCLTLCDPMDCSPPGFYVCEISRQGYWGGLPFPAPGDLPDPGIEPWVSCTAGRFLTDWATRRGAYSQWGCKKWDKTEVTWHTWTHSFRVVGHLDVCSSLN